MPDFDLFQGDHVLNAVKNAASGPGLTAVGGLAKEATDYLTAPAKAVGEDVIPNYSGPAQLSSANMFPDSSKANGVGDYIHAMVKNGASPEDVEEFISQHTFNNTMPGVRPNIALNAGEKLGNTLYEGQSAGSQLGIMRAAETAKSTLGAAKNAAPAVQNTAEELATNNPFASFLSKGTSMGVLLPPNLAELIDMANKVRYGQDKTGA